MALQNEDLFVIQRDDTHYNLTAEDLLTYTGVGGYLPLSGGAVTGTINFEGMQYPLGFTPPENTKMRINLNNNEGTVGLDIRLQGNTGTNVLRITGGEGSNVVLQKWVANEYVGFEVPVVQKVEATEDNHLVTKKYVDDNTAKPTVGDTRPEDASVGDFWYDTDNLELLIHGGNENWFPTYVDYSTDIVNLTEQVMSVESDVVELDNAVGLFNLTLNSLEAEIGLKADQKEVDETSELIQSLLERIETLEQQAGETPMFKALESSHTFTINSYDMNNKLYSTSNDSEWAENADRLWQFGSYDKYPSYDRSYSSGFFMPDEWLKKYEYLIDLPDFFSYSYWDDMTPDNNNITLNGANRRLLSGYPKKEEFHGVSGISFVFDNRYSGGNDSTIQGTWTDKVIAVRNKYDIIENGFMTGPEEIGVLDTPLHLLSNNYFMSSVSDNIKGTRYDKINFYSTNNGRANSTSYYNLNITGDGKLHFDIRVSSESGHDYGEVLLNDERKFGKYSGTSGTWHRNLELDVKKGDRVKFAYTKDNSVDGGEDRMYVENLYSEYFVSREDLEES